MQELFKTYENLPLPDPIKAAGIIILIILFVIVCLPIGLASWQILLDFVHPPTGKKFKSAVNSCFPSNDDSKGP